jgi:exopolyphosphatase/guanosine-5'-triphosphate,3'-diphosphate pyrophosphatase
MITMSEPVAVIDTGSNSIKLLVARKRDGGGIETLYSKTIETRISEGISRELPRLQLQAMIRGCETIEELLSLARQHKPEKITIVATSAVRDAINGHDFIDRVEDSTGLHMRLLSGTEEAHYIGLGISYDPALQGVEYFLQVDLGGGSLELVRFKKREISQAISLRLGAVRMNERFLAESKGPIPRNGEAALSAFVQAELAMSEFKFSPRSWPLVATGGAFVVCRAILAAERGQSINDRNPIMNLGELEDLKNRLCDMTLEERMRVPHLPASRADIIPAALITIVALLKHIKRTHLTHSFYNLRYGIAAELLR